MAEQNRTHEVIRQCGGIVHGDGNIFFTNRYQFEHAASILLGYATATQAPPCGAGPATPSPAQHCNECETQTICTDFPAQRECGGDAPGEGQR